MGNTASQDVNKDPDDRGGGGAGGGVGGLRWKVFEEVIFQTSKTEN